MGNRIKANETDLAREFLGGSSTEFNNSLGDLVDQIWTQQFGGWHDQKAGSNAEITMTGCPSTARAANR